MFFNVEKLLEYARAWMRARRDFDLINKGFKPVVYERDDYSPKRIELNERACAMETRNIFIDTSIFVEKNYTYRAGDLERINRLAKSDRASVFVTDITIREVKAHIDTDISKAIQASEKFQKDARALRNIDTLPFVELFQPISKGKSIQMLKSQLCAYLDEVKATKLNTSEVSIGAVFDKYFGKHPPFGEGKKKAEFPDAFAIEALEGWCKENDERIYVVSADQDFKEHCKTSDRLIALNGLTEFIAIVVSHDKVLVPSVRNLIDNNKKTIDEAIGVSFCEQGFWIEDQDGDVGEVKVNQLEIDDILILDIEQESAVFHVNVNTYFSAYLSYADMDTAVYDSEDKVLLPWHTIEKTVDRDVEYAATIHVSHDVKNSGSFIVERVEIETEQDFGFAVVADDEWPHK